MSQKAIELKVKNFLENFKSRDIYNYAITLSPILKEPDRYIDYRKQLAELLIAVPKLTEYDPRSLIYATFKAYEQGYSFSPKDAEAYFIPYNNEIQFQKGYRGIMKDLMKRPDVIEIIADVVYENDEIEIEKDKSGRTYLKRHSINPFKPRGEIIGAYAFVHYKVEGEGIVENGVVMSAEEIEKDYRSLSKADKAMGKNSFWEKWKADMYKKTVIKQLRKILPPLPEEKINVFEKEKEVAKERKQLIEEFNQAFIQSGLTAQELRKIIYTKYSVDNLSSLTNEQIAEFTKLLKEKGRVLLETEMLISDKELQELNDLFREKGLDEFQEKKVYEHLGIDPDKKPNQEEYELIKGFLTSNDAESIINITGDKEVKQVSLEELEHI